MLSTIYQRYFNYNLTYVITSNLNIKHSKVFKYQTTFLMASDKTYKPTLKKVAC